MPALRVRTFARSVLATFCLASLSLVPACGLKGLGDKDSVAPEPPPLVPEPTDPRATHVMLNDLRYPERSLPPCVTAEGRPVVAPLGDALAVDGKLAEWGARRAVIADPEADAAVGSDLRSVWVARQDEDLAIALAGALTAPLHFEFGGVAARGGRLDREVRRLVRVTPEADGLRVESRESGQWKIVAPEAGRAGRGDDGTEVWLSARLLGDAVTWPVWWLRVYTSAADDLVGRAHGDSTEAAVFHSLLDADARPMSIVSCMRWLERSASVDLALLSDVVTVQPDDAGAPRQLDRAELVFGAARFALNAVASIFSQSDWPVTKLAFVATDSAVSEPLAVSGSRPAREAGYLVLAVNARPFDRRSPETFPQGVVIPRIEAGLLELMLGAIFPAADDALRQAMRVALLDLLLQRDFGLSFWLDRFPAANIDWADGFGHILASRYSPSTLVAAWKAAAEASGDPRERFAQSLIDSFEAAEQRQLAQSVVAGWLVGDAYDPRFAPETISDHDGDGLPGFVEILRGTDPAKFDSDGDGWSDFAETLAGEGGAMAMTRTPMSLMPDASFSDWLELLPKRVIVDKGSSGACPKAADVAHFGAVATKETLWIGAVATDFWDNEPGAKWEGVIDLPKVNKQFLVTATSGSREFVVKDKDGNVLKRYRRAMPMARKTIEWVIHREDLGFAVSADPQGGGEGFAEHDAVSLRLRTVFNDGEDRFCDETAWFAPSVSY